MGFLVVVRSMVTTALIRRAGPTGPGPAVVLRSVRFRARRTGLARRDRATIRAPAVGGRGVQRTGSRSRLVRAPARRDWSAGLGRLRERGQRIALGPTARRGAFAGLDARLVVGVDVVHQAR